MSSRRQIEEDGHATHKTGDQEKLQQAKVAECKGQWDRPEQRRADQVGGDQDAAPSKPIDPDAGEQCERGPGECPGRVEDAHLYR